MNFEKYIRGISFRFVKPGMPVRLPFSLVHTPRKKLEIMFLRMQTWLEFVNTFVPEDAVDIRGRLRPVCQIPKMSTLAIGAIINRGVSQLPDGQVFVNVGVWHGFTFLAGLAGNKDKKCFGVDNFSEFSGPKEPFLAEFGKYCSGKHHFVEMDYREYFRKVHKEPIGFYIYDGEHSYENQMEGLKIAEPFFADGCIVLVDDTNIPHVHAAAMDFIDQSQHKYHILLDQKTYCNAHPTYWNGIMVFQKTK